MEQEQRRYEKVRAKLSAQESRIREKQMALRGGVSAMASSATTSATPHLAGAIPNVVCQSGSSSDAE